MHITMFFVLHKQCSTRPEANFTRLSPQTLSELLAEAERANTSGLLHGFLNHRANWHNTHDEHCNVFLTLGACNSQLVLLHGNTRYVILVDVIPDASVF
jgi:hypothetical protein